MADGWLTRRIWYLRTWIRDVLAANLSARSVGFAVASGVFIGLLPIFSLHIVACVATARVLRLNYAVVYLASNLAFNPISGPFVLAAEVAVGEWLLFGEVRSLALLSGHAEHSLMQLGGEIIWACFLGSIVIGAVLAPLAGLASYVGWRWREHRAAERLSPKP